MSVILRKIGLVFTALLLIAASGGYSIYRHYCDCQNLLKTSVFLEVECKHEQAGTDATSCCSIETHEIACCSSESQTGETDHCHSGDCCQTNIEFLKINDSYTSGQDKTSFKVFTLFVKLFENELLFTETLAEPAGNFFSDSSPPFTGKQLLLEIHQLKLAPELG
jgi:hypothetical protein